MARVSPTCTSAKRVNEARGTAVLSGASGRVLASFQP